MKRMALLLLFVTAPAFGLSDIPRTIRTYDTVTEGGNQQTTGEQAGETRGMHVAGLPAWNHTGSTPCKLTLTSSMQEIKCGASAQAGRESILIQAQGGTAYWGIDPNSTTLTFELSDKGERLLPASEDVPFYVWGTGNLMTLELQGAGE